MLSGRIIIPLLRTSHYISPLKSACHTVINNTLFVRFVSTKKVVYICGDKEFVGSGKLGDTLLDVVINNDLPLDGFGACEGTLACCTCHVILSPEHFDRVDRINPAGEEELDLLDLAPELSDRSRLGCQVQLDSGDPDVLVVNVPVQKRDARALD